MKAIKIILGVITFLIIVFFSTGIFIKETTYTCQVLVDKPLQQVFTVFNDTAKIKNWIPEIKSLKVITTTPNRIGSVYEMVANNRGQEITMTESVLEYEENKKVSHYVDAQNMLKTDRYTFFSESGKTKIILQSSCQSNSYIISCIFPYSKGIFKEIDQGHLNNFKEYIENK